MSPSESDFMLNIQWHEEIFETSNLHTSSTLKNYPTFQKFGQKIKKFARLKTHFSTAFSKHLKPSWFRVPQTATNANIVLYRVPIQMLNKKQCFIIQQELKKRGVKQLKFKSPQ